MIRIGITGHRVIPEAMLAHVRERLTAAVCRRPGPVEALSSLAAGADQLFAEVALECGADLTVVTPSHDYEHSLGPGDTLTRYRQFMSKARAHVALDYPQACDQAYYAAGVYIADHCDLILAVWDGQPARGHGGTAEIVDYARQLGKPVCVIWKPGVRRP